MAPSLFFFIVIIQVFVLNASTCYCAKSHKFSALLIFGDSTVDTGNNNYLNTIVRSDHSPYGENFPSRIATGRFSDGKLVPDFMASIFGIKDTVPPFLNPHLSDDELRTGVSFASAGSGYDDLTTVLTGIIPMSKQPDYLRNYVKRLERIVGKEKAKKIVNGALVIVSAGTNDFTLNYYDLPQRMLEFTISEYQDFVLNNLQNVVKELYEIGCRSIVVAGLPPVGCLPLQMTLQLHLGTCIHYQNSDAQSYNQKLASLIPQLETSLPGSKIIYADIYAPMSNMLNNPQKYGFVETRRGCCGTGLLEAGPFCSAFSPVCPNPSQFLFWDDVHLSQSGYRYLSEAFRKQILGKLK